MSIVPPRRIYYAMETDESGNESCWPIAPSSRERMIIDARYLRASVETYCAIHGAQPALQRALDHLLTLIGMSEV